MSSDYGSKEDICIEKGRVVCVVSVCRPPASAERKCRQDELDLKHRIATTPDSLTQNIQSIAAHVAYGRLRAVQQLQARFGKKYSQLQSAIP